jgi:hypothetical protein
VNFCTLVRLITGARQKLLEWWLGRTASHLAPLRTAHSRERWRALK